MIFISKFDGLKEGPRQTRGRSLHDSPAPKKGGWHRTRRDKNRIQNVSSDSSGNPVKVFGPGKRGTCPPGPNSEGDQPDPRVHHSTVPFEAQIGGVRTFLRHLRKRTAPKKDRTSKTVRNPGTTGPFVATVRTERLPCDVVTVPRHGPPSPSPPTGRTGLGNQFIHGRRLHRAHVPLVITMERSSSVTTQTVQST